MEQSLKTHDEAKVIIKSGVFTQIQSCCLLFVPADCGRALLSVDTGCSQNNWHRALPLVAHQPQRARVNRLF